MTRMFVVAALVAACLPLSAEEVTLQKGEGLAAALHRAGCRPGWLAETMRLSGIPPWRLKKLHPSQAITIPDDCASRVPRDLARESAEVISVAKTLQEADKLKGDLADAQTLVQTLNTRLLTDRHASEVREGNLSARITTLRGERDRALAKSTQSPTRKVALIGAAAGFVLSMLIATVIFWQWKKRMVVFPKVLAVSYEGRTFRLASTTPSPTYQCSEHGCHERNLTKKHAARHLGKHPHLRREVVDGKVRVVRPLFTTANYGEK